CPADARRGRARVQSLLLPIAFSALTRAPCRSLPVIAWRAPRRGEIRSMMQLLSNPLSPYGRKVKIAMAMNGLVDRIEVLKVDTKPLAAPEIVKANPLGKIPALVVDGDTAIFDSHVICEYLDSLAPAPVLFPRSGVERVRTLTLGALADGVLDAALLL